jgi:hypothetical protein
MLALRHPFSSGLLAGVKSWKVLQGCVGLQWDALFDREIAEAARELRIACAAVHVAIRQVSR